MNRIKLVRLLFSLFGMLLIATAIAFLRMADMGTDPFTTLNLGLSEFLNIRFGTLVIYSNAVLLLIVFFTNRRFIGLGTVLSILLVGNVSDVLLLAFREVIGDVSSLWIRLAITLIGVVVLAIGVAAYIVADLGVGPIDALPIIVEEKANGKISFLTARITIDVLCVALGFLLGATLGISTIVTAFFMGPLIHVFRTRFQRMFQRIKPDTH